MSGANLLEPANLSTRGITQLMIDCVFEVFHQVRSSAAQGA